MAITYRTAGAWGAGKGSNLTPAEVDLSFYDLHGRVDDLETNPPEPVEISNITQSGSQLTIHKADATEYGPFTLPTARYNHRGVWAAATYYAANDTVEIETGVDAGLYIVLISHTSDATFDPDAVSGSDPIYFASVGGGAGGGGVVGVVLVNDATQIYGPTAEQAGYLFRGEYDGMQFFTVPHSDTIEFPVGTTFWVQAWFGMVTAVKETATAMEVYGPDGYEDYTRNWYSVLKVTQIALNEWIIEGDLASSIFRTVSTTTFTPSYPTDTTATNKLFNCTHASGCTVTIPPYATGFFVVGTEFSFRQGDAGSVTLTPGSGVTILHKSGSTRTTTVQGAVMTLRHVELNTWVLSGEAA
jgi:hypothetical protein